MRNALCVGAISLAGALSQLAAADHSKRFYSDDPLWREPPPRGVTGIAPRNVDHIYDFLYSSYVTPRRLRKAAQHGPQPALDVNTLGEVPDSAWYTNRHASHRMSIADLRRGPGDSTPPDLNSARITAAKSNGVTPGFVIEDGRKNRYLLKFDPPQYPELCSAADVIGSKLFYALGYNTPENYIVHFRREQLQIKPGVVYRDPSGKKLPLTPQLVDKLLQTQTKSPDGTYRALASRWLEGRVAGPFDYSDTRSDDPNDTIPHQNRRVLRGLAVFGSWVNHHDSTQINTMDTLVTEDGRQYIKHYLIDFGSILGSRGDRPKEPWIGHQYTIRHKESLARALMFGLHVPRWDRSHYPTLKGVGLFDAWSFDPLTWKPEVPNSAFLMMDRADAYWAAKQVAAFTDAEIRAIVETGKLSDPRATDWITDCLIKRRDKIAHAWFKQVLALDRFRIVEGSLAFDDLGAIYEVGSPKRYRVHWSSYDNDRDVLTPLSAASAQTSIQPSVPLPDMPGEGYWMALIETPEAPRQSVRVYIRKLDTVVHVVGVERAW